MNKFEIDFFVDSGILIFNFKVLCYFLVDVVVREVDDYFFKYWLFFDV